MHFTWASNGPSAPHFISCAPRQVRRLFSVVSLRSSYESCGWHLPVLLRGAPFHVWLWWQHFDSPEHLGRNAVLARLIRSRQSHWRIHGRRELDFLRSAECRGHGSIGTRPGLTVLCFDDWLRGMYVLPSWCPVVLWSEVRTAIVEDIASFALTLSGALCDHSVNAIVAQSMHVMAFSLSNTTIGGTTSDKRPQVPHRSW